MSNVTTKSRISQIMALAEQLPIFSFNDLLAVEKNHNYLKTLLSRYVKTGKLIRLKKGWYAASSYVLQTKLRGGFNGYLEFIANTLQAASYLSLDYVLHEQGLLTEMPKNFTSITLNRPGRFVNELGIFIYHKMSPRLFTGFATVKKGDFYLAKASPAKALFDWLYLRKNNLGNKNSIKELRLNLKNFSSAERRELKRYCELEGTKKMKKIYRQLFVCGKH